MLEKIAQNPEMISFEEFAKEERQKIRKAIQRERVRSKKRLEELSERQRDIREQRNKVMAKLYRRHYVSKAGKQKYSVNSECYKIFKKRFKDLTQVEKRKYWRIMMQKKRGGLSAVNTTKTKN